jgi:FKBP-type peptidyl-prolyl cis-trans isomerase
MKLKYMAGLLLGLLALQASAQDSSPLTSSKDKVSYAIGVEVAKSLKAQGVEVDTNIMIMGLKDALGTGKLLMTDEELKATMNTFQEDLKQKQQEMAAAAADTNKKAGDTFMAANAKKDGVTALPDGLQYKVEKAADGQKPTDDDTVVCNYKGTLIDGTEFDSSYTSGKPATFEVKGLIPGVREALKLMPVGSKWQFFIPSGMAYGERGAGPIGPNSTLIFEIELISIQGKSVTPGQPSAK